MDEGYNNGRYFALSNTNNDAQKNLFSVRAHPRADKRNKNNVPTMFVATTRELSTVNTQMKSTLRELHHSASQNSKYISYCT